MIRFLKAQLMFLADPVLATVNWNIFGAEYCATGLLLCKWSLWCFRSALKWKIEGSFFFMAEVAGEEVFRWSEIFLHVWLGFGSLLQPLCPLFTLSLSCACPYYSCSLPPFFFLFMLTGKKRSLVGEFPWTVMLAALTLFSVFSECCILGLF